MPPRRPAAERDYDGMVDENALHITSEQASTFGERREVLKESEAMALRQKAAQTDQLQQLVEQLQQQGASGLAVQDGSLIVGGFQFSPTGLIAPDEFSGESWEQVGLLLLRLEGSIQWLIGDWLVYGAGVHYGELEQFAAQIGREYKTLRNYMVVSRGVDLSRRRDNLSFGHHEAIANLDADDQETALAYAAENGLSVANFRKWLRGDQGAAAPALGAGDGLTTDTPRYHVTKIWESIEAMQSMEWRRIPARERQARIDDIATLRQRLDAAEKWLREGPEG